MHIAHAFERSHDGDHVWHVQFFGYGLQQNLAGLANVPYEAHSSTSPKAMPRRGSMATNPVK